MLVKGIELILRIFDGSCMLKKEYLPDPDISCLNGCLLFLEEENGVIGAFGSKRLRLGSFSKSFLQQKKLIFDLFDFQKY